MTQDTLEVMHVGRCLQLLTSTSPASGTVCLCAPDGDRDAFIVCVRACVRVHVCVKMAMRDIVVACWSPDVDGALSRVACRCNTCTS